ncbi:MAG: prepilin-type N-terminal cleavage/methylation domain-containing protein [Phycisphaerales bacterium]
MLANLTNRALRPTHARRAFSMIELVIVVVIIGIIGAIAIPRMSRGASGAADSALVADLAVLRNAIDLYEAEHQGLYPTETGFESELTQYTDIAGDVSASKDTTHVYGPYLRAVPALKVGSNKGDNTVSGTSGGTEGWLYDEDTGDISANLAGTELDDRGVAYSSY